MFRFTGVAGRLSPSVRRVSAGLLLLLPFGMLLALGPDSYFLLPFSRLSLCVLIFPLIAILIAPDPAQVRTLDWALAVSLLSVSLILAAQIAVGAAKSIITARSWWASGFEMTVIGFATGSVTFGLGKLFHIG